MIRQHLFDKRAPADPMFRWRGGDVSRIESLTDGVFAFALTLIVVSLDVPGTFDELKTVMLSFPIFAVCFMLLVMVWYYHYKFFRRFGLEDFPTIILNIVLLFVVLFYVYPLKFVFTRVLGPWLGIEGASFAGASLPEVRLLMVFYGAGVVLIFGLFALMNYHGYRLREALELDELEIYLTRSEIGSHMISAGIGLLSIALALTLPGQWGPAMSGMIYFLMGPAHTIFGVRRGKRAEAMHHALLEEKSAAPGA